MLQITGVIALSEKIICISENRWREGITSHKIKFYDS